MSATIQNTVKRISRGCLIGLGVLLLGISAVGDVWGQRDLPPEKGGLTYELGMPPVYKGRTGFELGWYRPQNNSDPMALYNLGVAKSLGSPVVGIAALRLEGYIGVAGEELDGGGRLLFEVPMLFIGAGVDYNIDDQVADLLLTVDLPLRRGGIFGRGSTFAVRWLPARDQTVTLGINLPLWGRNIGETRPKKDHVRLDESSLKRLELDLKATELPAGISTLRERANWVANLTQPFTDQSGADPSKALEATISEIQQHIAEVDKNFPDGHTLPAEIRVYHETLDRLFSEAAGVSDVRGAEISRRARAVLLEEVLLPYNYYLGQRKVDDSLKGMIGIAQTRFAGWVLSDHDLSNKSAQRVFYVFQSLCDIMEEMRSQLKDRWEDSRFVWLPLQYALTPEQYDSQEELNDIIAQATQRKFTHENRVWYVINEEFQWEMARSVREANDYHVLWIHDFRGMNGEGQPDAIAYAQTLNYLEALRERVEAYDQTNKMPQYFIFLDQHYFELNKARLWLRLLLDPLDYELSLPGDHAEWEEQIHLAQDRLREAVAKSTLLTVGTGQYGKDWLKDQIKVHVNITNPADPSFYSWHAVGIIPVQDNIIRDHRKIAFYDVTEEDPYRGMAMFTGMGIGEHYVGANWEDRAIMIQGPGALAVKDGARELLEAQGFDRSQIPYPLRQQNKPVSYGSQISTEHAARTPDWVEDRGQVLQLHNKTGYADKPINVAKAVLYSLMPSGSVLKVPDSLWQSYIYASLLSGSALRGCRVMIIAPTKDSAPSGAPPTLARAHGMLGRLIVFSNALDTQTAAQGGLLKVGLYAPKQGVGDIAGRFEQSVNNVPSWIGSVYPDNPQLYATANETQAILDSLGFEVGYLAEPAAATGPKIHMKANFFASKDAWNALNSEPAMAAVLREYIIYLARQVGKSDDAKATHDVRRIPEQLSNAWYDVIEKIVAEMTPQQRQETIYYFTVGSTNMDYRSMVMDGEAMVILGGWQSLFGYLDFLLLPGLCEWLETTEELDALLPPPGGMTRSMAGLLKLSL